MKMSKTVAAFAVVLMVAGIATVSVGTPAVEAGQEYWLAPWTWGRAERAAEINAGLSAMMTTVRLIWLGGLSVAIGATIISYRASAVNLAEAIKEIRPVGEVGKRLGELDEGLAELRRDVRQVISAISAHMPPTSPISVGSTPEPDTEATPANPGKTARVGPGVEAAAVELI